MPEGPLDIEHFRHKLIDLEQQLTDRSKQETETARSTEDERADPLDRGVVDDLKDNYLKLAESDSEVLTQVRDALGRIDTGNFGRCAADGQPIDERRLEAVPWAAYCVKHQDEREQREGLRTPSL
jgi:DnaK suppressor protein